jgi:hypothetical protein
MGNASTFTIYVCGDEVLNVDQPGVIQTVDLTNNGVATDLNDFSVSSF